MAVDETFEHVDHKHDSGTLNSDIFGLTLNSEPL